jgi:hypothetical protein
MKRSNQHIGAGIAFIIASIIVAAIVYGGYKISRINEDYAPKAKEADASVIEAETSDVEGDDGVGDIVNASEPVPDDTTAEATAQEVDVQAGDREAVEEGSDPYQQQSVSEEQVERDRATPDKSDANVPETTPTGE